MQLTGKLSDMRETVRRLHGERYAEVIAPWCDVVRRVADKRRLSLLNAGVLLAEGATDEHDGMAALLVLAATVECIEPSVPDDRTSTTEEAS